MNISAGTFDFSDTHIKSLTVFTTGGITHLYAGTRNDVTGGQVWRSPTGDPGTWTQVPIATLHVNNRRITSLTVFGGHLYVGTDNWVTGGEIWRTAGGPAPSWERVDGGGFGAANREISSMAVLDGHLYAGTENRPLPPAPSTGGEVWRTAGGPAPSWERVDGGVFGADNEMISSMAVFTTGGVTRLYAGTFTEGWGARGVWRTAGGSAPITWERVDGGVFGTANVGIISMAVFGGRLYVGTLNYPPPPAVPTGAEVWRWDGTSWLRVTPAGLHASNEGASSMAVFGGRLYVGTYNWIMDAEVWRWDGTGWIQVGSGGFGAINNEFVIPPVAFGVHLYAGTFNPTGGEIWRSSDGTTWTQVNTDGFGNTNNVVTIPTVVFGSYLYAGTANEVTGGEIWRSPDGITWTQVATGGFVSVNNTSVFPWAVFGGNLYVGTFNEMTGGEVWRSPTGDSTSWDWVVFGGFGDSRNVDIFPIVVFDGHLYAGTSNWTTGGEVWRSPTGHFGTWTQVNVDGFGDANNEQVAPWAVFEGRLYVGTRNNPPPPAVGGGQIWRTAGGVTPAWERVDGGAFGAVNEEITTMAVFTTGGITHLYAGTGNEITGGEVWRSLTGAINSWTQVNLDGFGDVNNASAFPMAVFGDRLYAGTSNWTTGGEVWRTDGTIAPIISHSPSSFSFTATEGGANPPAQTLSIWNTGGGTLNWSVSHDAPPEHLSLTPTSGSSTGETDPVTVSVSITGLAAATYSTTITITATGATNTPQTVTATLTITALDPGPTPAPDDGCIIATAVYGTPMAEEVEVLSRFRDQYMVTNELGRRFVSLYYQHSPAIAEYISEREWAKKLVRVALLPVVRVVEFIVGE